MATASASVEPSTVVAAPGSMAEGQLHVRNEGQAEVRFTFEVVGDDGSWVSVSPSGLSIPAGSEGTARIFYRPPRSPALRAGPHAVGLRIRAGGDRTQVTTAAAEVDVTAFTEISLLLDPTPSANGRGAAHRLSIDNRGNSPLLATVAGASPAHDVAVSVDPSAVEVEPGATVSVQVAVRARRRLFASGQDRPFNIVVQPAGGDSLTAEGSTLATRAVSRRVMGSLVTLGTVALIALVLRVTVFPSPSPSPGADAGTGASAASTCPGAGHLAHEANGQIRHEVVQPDNYSFLFLKPGGCLPVRWNPCTPIHYVVNGLEASNDQLADTNQAITEIAQATGIDFVYDGPTTENKNTWRFYDPPRYGIRWAPVLIDWGHLEGGASLTEVTGGGIPAEIQGVDVSGEVVLNVDAHLVNNAPVATGFGSGATWGRILLHELGHLLGLGHVTGYDQIMHDPVTEQTAPTAAYGFGDRAGLRLLGKAAGCVTTPPLPGGGS